MLNKPIINESIIKAKTATQVMFLVCGLALSSWAPMVPFAKDRLGLNDGELGLLLLCLGGGALLTMPLSGFFIGKLGSRQVILISGIIAAVVLPVLLMVTNSYLMACVLFIFGCSIGSIDVAMNAHGVQVQNAMGKPIMSSLHGLFSVGGLFGSIGLGFLIKMGLIPIYAAVTIAIFLILLLILQYRKLLGYHKDCLLYTSPSPRD